LDEETRRHKETILTVQKKERKIKETKMRVDEEHNAFMMAEDTVMRLNEKLNIFKRQVADAEGLTMQNMQRVRRYHLELEETESRADQAESSLSIIQAKHRSSINAQRSGSPSVYLMEEEH